MLREDLSRARNVEPLPVLAAGLVAALEEGADLDLFDPPLVDRKLELFLASDLGSMVAGEVPVVAKKGITGTVVARILESQEY